jgi:hypothetical protein
MLKLGGRGQRRRLGTRFGCTFSEQLVWYTDRCCERFQILRMLHSRCATEQALGERRPALDDRLDRRLTEYFGCARARVLANDAIQWLSGFNRTKRFISSL